MCDKVYPQRGRHTRQVTGKREKRRRRTSGRFAEFLARAWLRLHGWRILGHRVRTPLGEVDIIARRGRQLLFVEVKQRRTLEEADLALLPRQRQRIVRAARCWLGRHPRMAAMDVRFDLIAVNRFGWLRHHRNAFQEDGE